MGVVHRKYAICPHCNKVTNSRVDHLLQFIKEPATRYYNHAPWSCSNCGHYFNVEIEITPTEVVYHIYINNSAPDIPAATLLLHNNRVLIIRDWYYNGEEGNKQYLYEEHQCPTNILNSEVAYYLDLETNDSDKHGMFTHVKTMPMTTDMNSALQDVEDTSAESILNIFGMTYDAETKSLKNLPNKRH